MKSILFLTLVIAILSIANCDSSKDLFLKAVDFVKNVKESGELDKLSNKVEEIAHNSGLGKVADKAGLEKLVEKIKESSKNVHLKEKISNIEDKVQEKLGHLTGVNIDDASLHKEHLEKGLKAIKKEISVLGLTGLVKDKVEDVKDVISRNDEIKAKLIDLVKSYNLHVSYHTLRAMESFKHLSSDVVKKIADELSVDFDKIVKTFDNLSPAEQIEKLRDLSIKLGHTIYHRIDLEEINHYLSKLHKEFLSKFNEALKQLPSLENLSPEIRSQVEAIKSSLKGREEQLRNIFQKWESSLSEIKSKLQSLNKIDKWAHAAEHEIKKLTGKIQSISWEWKNLLDKLSNDLSNLRHLASSTKDKALSRLHTHLAELEKEFQDLSHKIQLKFQSAHDRLSNKAAEITDKVSKEIEETRAQLSKLSGAAAENALKHLSNLVESAASRVDQSELTGLRQKLSNLKKEIKSHGRWRWGKSVENENDNMSNNSSTVMIVSLVIGALVVLGAVMVVIFTVVKKRRVYVPLDKQENVIDA